MNATADEATLRSEAGLLFGFAGPRLIAGAMVVALAARIALGAWRWVDLVVVGAILAFEPFTEWLIHVLVLHFRPRRVGGRTIDPLLSRKHRAHHADPRDRELVLVPFPVLVVGIALDVPLLLLLDDTRLLLTGLAAGYAMLLAYEWTHHLIHSSYRPQGRYYRSIWRAHRLHHFRNERYWFGVTVNLADHVLRTFPARDAVPVSPTARSLGVGSATG